MDDFSKYIVGYWESNPGEKDLITKAHLDRAEKGAQVWNKWAEDFKVWIDTNDVSCIIHFDDFHFEDVFSAIGFIFPCEVSFNGAFFEKFANFANAVFHGDVDFVRAEFNFYPMAARFNGAKFIGEFVSFERSIFRGGLLFYNAKFECEYVNFNETQFLGIDKNFIGAIFEATEINFRETIFENGRTEFTSARINAESIDFTNAKFLDTYTCIDNASFLGDSSSFIGCLFNQDIDFNATTFDCFVMFNSTKFKGVTSFEGSKFKKHVDFKGVAFMHEITFRTAKFLEVPDFNFATFVQPPYLSQMDVPRSNKNNKHVESYRKLKQMSVLSNDHQNEIKYFGYEMLSKLYLKESSCEQKALIWLYHFCSNFGQSIFRPFICLIGFLAIALTLNYLLIEPNMPACKDKGVLFFSNLISYTMNNSIPLFKIEESQRDIIYGCLFGDVPLKWTHSLWQSIHLIPSAVFIFLIGLGVRNRFKID